MRVVILNDRLNAGGAEKVIVSMANLLHRQNVLVSVVLFLNQSALDKQLHKEIPVYYLNRKGRFDFNAMKMLKQLVKDADIVHVHSRYNLRYFMLSGFITGIYKPKIVFHEHVPGYKNIDFLTALLFKKIDAYVAVAKSACQWAINKRNIPAEKVFYLPNIVADPPINAGIVYTPKKIMMAGNFRKVKNHLFAIDILKLLDAEFMLDLYGIADEPAYYNEVEKAIENAGLKHRIKIVNGIHNIYEVLPQYHFALHTAKNETGPLVLLEYLKAGLPFLTFNTGDVVENLKEELPELIMNSFIAEDWKNKIESIMLNEDYRNELLSRMKNLAEEKFSSQAFVSSLVNIYNRILQ